MYDGAVRIELVRGKCNGYGLCEEHCPEVYELEDDGKARILIEGTIPPELELAAREGAKACPEQALIIHDEPA